MIHARTIRSVCLTITGLYVPDCSVNRHIRHNDYSVLHRDLSHSKAVYFSHAGHFPALVLFLLTVCVYCVRFCVKDVAQTARLLDFFRRSQADRYDGFPLWSSGFKLYRERLHQLCVEEWVNSSVVETGSARRPLSCLASGTRESCWTALLLRPLGQAKPPNMLLKTGNDCFQYILLPCLLLCA